MQLPPGLTPPRQAQARNWNNPTYGKHTAAVAASMGTPLIPWQRYVADVAGEIDPRTGQLIYPTILLTGPRQIGKTTLDLASSVQNCMMGPDRRAWYTAQSGQHARDKWLEMTQQFSGPKSPLAPLAETKLTNGSERLLFHNGSTLRPHPPTADSLHSKQSDKNTVDEAWEFDQSEGEALMQAIVPTTTTRQMVTGQRPQLWITSTEGTVMSTWFNELLERARAGDPTICLFDWGIPNDADPTDLDAVWAAHPGAGYLFGRELLAEQLGKLGPSGFARGYGNRRTANTERVLPLELFNAAADGRPMPTVGPVGFAAAVAMDGADTTICAAMRVTETFTESDPTTGEVVSSERSFVLIDVVDHRPGTTWAAARIKDIHDRHGAAFAIDRFGPSAGLHDEVERLGVDLVQLNTGAVSASCLSVYNGVVKSGDYPTWRYRPHAAMDDAAELANRRTIGDGAWGWGRRVSVGSISAIEAGTLAPWSLDHQPEIETIQLG